MLSISNQISQIAKNAMNSNKINRQVKIETVPEDQDKLRRANLEAI